jgi:Na+/H+ antiporter NhaD/arsenite permease-like protein
MVTLLGAVMSVRSYFRLDLSGVGGAKPVIVKGTLQEYDPETNRYKVSYDEKTQQSFQQSTIDDIAFSIGMFFVVVGSVVQGYGDLLKYVL